MRIKIILPMIVMSAAIITFGINESKAGFPAPPGLPPLPGLPGPPNVNVRVNGYLPPPPGVHVMIDSGRPYYVERERRIYIEKERVGRHRHYKKEKRHHQDHGREHGPDRRDH